MKKLYRLVQDYNSRFTLPPHPIVFIFCFILIATNILVQWQINFFHFTITVGFLIYPLTFLVTDYVSEIYGKSKCTKLVQFALVFSIIPSIIFSTVQITFGSLFAYIVAQFHDIWAFHWWRGKTGEKRLWLRNNASTFVSQTLDTVIFASIAFYGVLETKTILSIIYTEIPLKLLYALIDTIPLYILVNITKRKRNLQL